MGATKIDYKKLNDKNYKVRIQYSIHSVYLFLYTLITIVLKTR